MPFLAPVFAAVGGAIASVSAWAAASPILAGIVQTAFGIAAKYALAALFPTEKPPAQSSQLETQYGEDIVRSVGLGKYGTNGHHVYRNAFGAGNRKIQDVYIVSHFRTKGLLRIRVDGEWRGIDPVADADGLHNVLGVEGTLRVQYFTGTMTQLAAQVLIDYANPPGRWTADHKGAGMSYVIVYQKLDREKRTSPIKPFFEIDGAPLYDWRLDTTAGGSGPQRWNDQSTWGGSGDYNPVVQMYNLERGFYNGTELMVGKAVSASRLPLSEWTVAANISDEISVVTGQTKYRASLIATSGMRVTHDSNMQPLLESCAGSWIENVVGEFPIVGAPQSLVATITDDDVMPGQPKRFTRYRPRAELVNTVASTYSNPEAFYEAEAGATRIDAAAVVFDRERLASAITYDAVIYPKQVDSLADIAIRGARYQASAEICVKPKWLDVMKAGRWIRWNSAEHGDFTYQIVLVSLGPLGPDGARLVYLNLRQIANGVFDPTAYVTNPPVVIPVGDPVYLAEVQGFVATPVIVTGTSGTEYAGVQLNWLPIGDDVTVTDVEIQYRPANEPATIFNTSVPRDVTMKTIVEGITQNSDWEFRTRLKTSPQRTVAWSAWTLVHTLVVVPDFFPIDLEDFADDVNEYLSFVSGEVREIIRQAQELATHVGDIEYGAYTQRQDIRREISLTAGNVTASYLEAITVATGPNSAIAQQLVVLNAAVNTNTANITALNQVVVDNQTSTANSILSLTSTINGISANTTFRAQTVAAPSGYTARIALQARVDTSDSYKSAGIFLDVTTTLSRVAVIADQFVVASGADLRNPFIFTAGVLTLNVLNAGTITAGLLRSSNSLMQIQLDNARIIMSDLT